MFDKRSCPLKKCSFFFTVLRKTAVSEAEDKSPNTLRHSSKFLSNSRIWINRRSTNFPFPMPFVSSISCTKRKRKPIEKSRWISSVQAWVSLDHRSSLRSIIHLGRFRWLHRRSIRWTSSRSSEEIISSLSGIRFSGPMERISVRWWFEPMEIVRFLRLRRPSIAVQFLRWYHDETSGLSSRFMSNIDRSRNVRSTRADRS